MNSLLLLTLFETAVQEDISAGRLSPDVASSLEVLASDREKDPHEFG